MKNDWTEEIDRLTRELADAKSANEAMRSCADQRQEIIEKMAEEIAALRRENALMLEKWKAYLEKLLCKGRA
jgi:uncharacterized protein (DUF3084 family)